jgi:hypothetical protein
MTAVTFDTLKFANGLKAAGVPAQQAEAEAEALVDALSSSDLATRTVLIELKTDIIKWIVGIALAQIGLLVGIMVKLLTFPTH